MAFCVQGQNGAHAAVMGGGFSKARIARFRRARDLDFADDAKLVVPAAKRADLERLAETFPTLPRRPCVDTERAACRQRHQIARKRSRPESMNNKIKTLNVLFNRFTFYINKIRFALYEMKYVLYYSK